MKFQVLGLELSCSGEKTPLPEETFPQAPFLPGTGPTQSRYKRKGFWKTFSLLSPRGLRLWEVTSDASPKDTASLPPPCEELCWNHPLLLLPDAQKGEL